MALDLRNMDCMELMKQFPDKHFDLAIVDPPYGIGADKAQNNAAEQRIKANGKSKAGRGWKKYRETDWDSDIPKAEYFIELERVSKNQIVWGGNYFFQLWQTPCKGFIIWDKGQRDFSLADCELAWTSFDKCARIVDISRGEALAENNNTGGRIHPTQKPVALYKWLLNKYAKEGDKILDTHLGSGSIAIACHDYKFDLVGSEIDSGYYNDLMKRVQNHVAQQSLF